MTRFRGKFTVLFDASGFEDVPAKVQRFHEVARETGFEVTGGTWESVPAGESTEPKGGWTGYGPMIPPRSRLAGLWDRLRFGLRRYK